MRLTPKAMALSLVSIGFSARGRIRENILILRSWEVFPIVIALRIWGPLMADRCIIFRTDNAAFVDIINQQTSKPKLVMALVRDLVLTSLQYNIVFRTKHIKGVHNTLADHISRFLVDKFQELYPGVDPQPASVPERLLPESWSLT